MKPLIPLVRAVKGVAGIVALRGIFGQHQAGGVRQEVEQQVEEGGLAGIGAPTDQNMPAGSDILLDDATWRHRGQSHRSWR